MKRMTIRKIFLYGFLLFSLVVLIYGIMFAVSQMVNIKYYFDDSLPNSSNSSIPICEKEFFLELVFYAKFVIVYAVYGLILSIHIQENPIQIAPLCQV